MLDKPLTMSMIAIVSECLVLEYRNVTPVPNITINYEVQVIVLPHLSTASCFILASLSQEESPQ